MIRPICPASLDTSTQLWLSKISVRPNGGVIKAVDKFIKQCKVDGNWTLLDRFWIYGQDVQANAVFSVVNPASSTASEHGSPIWTSYKGYTGDGSSAYINLNFTPATDAVNMTSSNACIFSYSLNNVASINTCPMGVYDGVQAEQFLENNAPSTGFVGNVHATTLTLTNSGIRNDRLISAINNGAQIKNYRLGVLTGTSSVYGNGSLCTMPVYALARNNSNAGIFSPTSNQIFLQGIGSGSIDQTKLNVACTNLYNDLQNINNGIAEKRTIVFCAGQSNMANHWNISGNLPAQYQSAMPNAWVMSSGQFANYHAGYNEINGATNGTTYCMSASLAYRLTQFYNHKIVVVNSAVGSTCLCNPALGGTLGTWNVNVSGDKFDRAINQLFVPAFNQGNTQDDAILVYGQGESDATDQTAANNYYTNLAALIAKMRTSVESGGSGYPNLKVIIVKIRDTAGTYVSTIAQAQIDVCNNISNCYLYDTSNLNLDVDNIHWTPASAVQAGLDVADIIHPLIQH